MTIEEIDERVEGLLAVMDLLPAGKQVFAKSLCQQWQTKKKLSDKQLPWLDKLLALAAGDKETPAPADVLLVGDPTKAVDLLKHAATQVKYPKLRIYLPDALELRLFLSGSGSKYPGTIQVTSPGSWHTRTWYCRVSPEGNLVIPKEPSEKLPTIAAFLVRFLADPKRILAENGKLSGHCCMCNLPITDEKSKAVGYGPHCAAKWNLPWG